MTSVVRAVRLWVLLVAAIVALPVRAASHGEPSLAFTGVTVLDVDSGHSYPRRTVLVVGKKIAAVGKDGSVSFPPGTDVHNANGAFLIPGLWNMHVHSGTYEEAAKALPKLLAYGITGVRDMGSPLDDVLRLRRDIAQGTLLGPRMVVAGPIIQGPLPFKLPLLISVHTESEARSAVDFLKRRGVDFIKVQDTLPRDLYLVVIDEAKRQGLPVAGHIPPSVPGSQVCGAGQVSVEHLGGAFMGVLVACSTRKDELYRREQEMIATALRAMERGEDPKPAHLRADFCRELLESYSMREASALFACFRRHRTWQCPTLVTLRGLWEGSKQDLTDEDRQYGVKVFEKDLEVVGAMYRARVQFLAGTDLPLAGDPASLHEELILLVRAGLTPLDALRAATRNPAEFFGRLDSFGRIAAGKQADLVLLDANPLDDIRNTSRIRAVVADGRYYDRVTLDRLLHAPAGADIQHKAGGSPSGLQ